jgi:transcriptional regulator with XRE-family HTH domain
MTLINNIEWKLLTDDQVLKKLGAELRRMRLERNLTQATVAERAGVDRTTVVKLEAGNANSLINMVQVLRALGRLDVLDNFHQEQKPTPFMVVEMQEKYLRKQRKRASSKQPDVVPPKPKSTW